MSPRRSLTFRLVAGVVLAQLVLAAGLVWAGTAFAERQLRVAFDTALRGRLMSVAALVRYAEESKGLLFDASLLPPARDRRHPVFYRVIGPNQVTVANSFPEQISLPPPPTRGAPRLRYASPVFKSFSSQSPSRMRYWRFRRDGVTYRGLVISRLPVLDTEDNPIQNGAELTVYYAAPMLDLRGEVTAAGIAIAVASLILLGLTSLLAAWAVKRELQPLRELARQAGAISPRNWSFQPERRIAATPELAPLIQALERMLDRLHRSYQQQREFMADAAHHLKTPVAILKSTLQSLARRPRPEAEYVAAAQASLQDVERLEQLLQRMLRLARLEQWADEGKPLLWQTTDLAATCQAAMDQVRPLAQARGVELHGAGMETKCPLHADPDDLELVWVNLLENAVEHSPSGGAVTLALAVHNGTAEITVRDQGSGIAPTEAATVFERFHRGDSSANSDSTNHFGLGLAITKAIVQTYGGTIGVLPGVNPGATLQVKLPLAAGWTPGF